MKATAYENLSYKALTSAPTFIVQSVKQNCHDTASILELGCGTGENLFALASQLPKANFVGVDISDINIQTAKKHSHQHQATIHFHTCDYLSFNVEPLDAIFAESVIHLIDSPDDVLFHKLAQDLKINGKLVITMPYDCLYNRFLITIRKTLKLIRNRSVDNLILKLAKWFYPNLDLQILQDRVHYMYVVPHRLDSDAFRNKLKSNYGFEAIESEVYPSSSFAKLKHKLIVFKKIKG